MTTEFAAWLVKNEVAIVAKEMRKKNKGIVKPKSEGAPLVNDNYVVRFANVHRDLAAELIGRYDGRKWGDGHILLAVKHIPAQKIIIINIKNV